MRTVAAWRMAFELEPEAAEKKAIGGIVDAAKSQADRKDAALLLARTMDEQMLAEHYDVASLLLDATLAMVTKMREPAMLKELKNRETEMKTWLKLWAEAREAKATLAGMPDDAAAHLTLGRYLCLVRNDWPAGSQHLIHGSDTLLQAAAKKELTSPASAEGQLELADAWWNIGEQEKEKGSVFPKIVWQDHAASWIRKQRQSFRPQRGTRRNQRSRSWRSFTNLRTWSLPSVIRWMPSTALAGIGTRSTAILSVG